MASIMDLTDEQFETLRKNIEAKTDEMPSIKTLSEIAKRIEQDASNPGSPKHISVDKLYYANGNYAFCHGCGAEIQGGNGRCRYCGRTYGK